MQARATRGGIDYRCRRCRHNRRTGDDGSRRRGEQDLRGAVTVLIDSLDPQRQPGEIRRDLECGTIGALERQVASRQQDDILEYATAWIGLELPDVGHRGVGDQPLRITRRDVVVIAHPGHADSQ
ncbi:hypothetical protein D3C71_1112120 [compost metagenome]